MQSQACASWRQLGAHPGAVTTTVRVRSVISPAGHHPGWPTSQQIQPALCGEYWKAAVKDPDVNWSSTCAVSSNKMAHINCTPQAWLAAHLAMAVALQNMRAGLPHVASVHDAAHLMERIVLAGHERLQEVRVPLAPSIPCRLYHCRRCQRKQDCNRHHLHLLFRPSDLPTGVFLSPLSSSALPRNIGAWSLLNYRLFEPSRCVHIPLRSPSPLGCTATCRFGRLSRTIRKPSAQAVKYMQYCPLRWVGRWGRGPSARGRIEKMGYGWHRWTSRGARRYCCTCAFTSARTGTCSCMPAPAMLRWPHKFIPPNCPPC